MPEEEVVEGLLTTGWRQVLLLNSFQQEYVIAKRLRDFSGIRRTCNAPLRVLG